MKDLHKIYALYYRQKCLICNVRDNLKWAYEENSIAEIDHHIIKAIEIGLLKPKLILKPFEELTDKEISNMGLWTKIGIMEKIHGEATTPYFYRDEFRELGYDCGYKSIDKLLDTEYAITMEEAKKLIKK